MKLESALKTSLEELRMQMLGAQVLFGFQFQALFQDNFEAVPPSGRAADAAALVLLVAVLGLILAVPSQHRIVDECETTTRLLRTAASYAKLTLTPLAAAVSCDFYVAAIPTFGAAASGLLAGVAFVIAMGAWYVLPLALRPRTISPAGGPMPHTKTALHAKIEQMLTEARVILPGAQALLGFQFIVMLTKAFQRLPASAHAMHLIGLSSLVLAVVSLIAPAAIHRIAFQGEDDARFQRIGSSIITLALLPLAVSMACELWVALYALYGTYTIATIGASLSAFALLMLWYVLPFAYRRGLRQLQAAG